MGELLTYQNTKDYHKALHQQKRAMEGVVDSSEFRHLRRDLLRLQEAKKQLYPYSGVAVITGEQPYGALGNPKVLGKRIFSSALAREFDDVETIELFANNDLVGSEPGFFRLVVPTLGTKEGVFPHNLLSARMRGNHLTANGITLPHEYVTAQVQKVLFDLPKHYPGKDRFDQKVAQKWASAYQDEPNYSIAHMKWLLGLEQELGIQLNNIAEEGKIDLTLAKNGGLELLNKLWVPGLKSLKDINYQPASLKLENPDLYNACPFNLEKDGVRLISEYANDDHSLIRVLDPTTKETSVITLDAALSGDYGFSFKAVPRVITYSLSGMDGHITGGGSVYNADARQLMDVFRLPYFPIVHMSATDAGEKIGVLQYNSLALLRDKPVDAKISAQRQVRQGNVSLLDFALSCSMEEAKKAIDDVMNRGGFRTDQAIRISNKVEDER